MTSVQTSRDETSEVEACLTRVEMARPRVKNRERYSRETVKRAPMAVTVEAVRPMTPESEM